MDAPQIQYARTQDGFSIAYWTLGKGEPIVDMGTPPFSHIQMEWELPEIRRWYETLAESHRLIRYDGRGSGLSEREINGYSLEGQLLDLDAVVERLHLRRFTLLGSVNSGAAAMAYAARRPNRVRRLILWCAYSRGSEFFQDTGTQALRSIVDQDWPMFSEAAARARFSWAQEAFAGEFAKLIRAAVTPKNQGALMDGLRRVDVTDALPSIKAPTLVMQREDRGVEVARRIVGLIPNARLVLFKGGSAATFLSDADEVYRAIAEFLASSLDSPVAALSPRELEALGLIADGKRNDEIATELCISVRTVERHIANLYTKLGIHSKAQAASYAHEHGLTRP